MITRILLVGIAIVACFFGIRHVGACTRDLLAFRRKAGSPYETIRLDDVVRYSEVRLKFGAATQPIVCVASIGRRRIALVNLPKSGAVAVIRRTPELDSSVKQRAGEAIPVYEVIGDVMFHFFTRYVVGLFLLLFGLLLFVKAMSFRPE